MFKKILALGVLLCLVSLAYAQEEKITITTYYPSPYGSYGELRSQRVAIGENYIKQSVVCWEGDTNCTGTSPQVKIPSANNVDLIVEGNVGIGTKTPSGRLSVYRAPLDYGPIATFEGDDFGNWGDTATRMLLKDTTGNINWYISANNDGGFAIHQGSAGDRIYIKNNGNVGIGAPDPQKKFHITGDGLRVDNTGESIFMTANTYMTLTQVDGAGVAGYAKIGAYRAGEGWKNLVLSGDGGNVGIGTTNPQTNKLEVVGGPIKATGGLIIQLVPNQATENSMVKTTGQVWLRTDM